MHILWASFLQGGETKKILMKPEPLIKRFFCMHEVVLTWNKISQADFEKQ